MVRWSRCGNCRGFAAPVDEQECYGQRRARRHQQGLRQRLPRRPGPVHRRRRRGVPRPGRSVRLRQVHRPADGRRARGHLQRRAADRRQAGQRARAPGPRHRDGVPVLRPLPAHERGRQHRLRAQAAQDAQGRDGGAHQEGRRHARADPAAGPQAQAALRRPAPARGHGSGDRARAAGVPHGRAAVEPRRQAARADARRDLGRRALAEDHHALRDPRPDRGHDDGRPHGRHEGRHPQPARHPQRVLRRAQQHLRRAVRRLTADEPGRRHGRPVR